MPRACPQGENVMRLSLKFAAHIVLPDKSAATFRKDREQIHQNGSLQSLSYEIFRNWVHIPHYFGIGDLGRIHDLLDNAHKLFTDAL
jgi:hypothetical protein